MPKSKKSNPFEAVDPEIIASMKSCTIPYLRNVIIQIITQYPEMTDPVKELLVNAKGNCGNDRVNTPGWNRQYDRASPTPLPLKSYTLSAGPTPSV